MQDTEFIRDQVNNFDLPTFLLSEFVARYCVTKYVISRFYIILPYVIRARFAFIPAALLRGKLQAHVVVCAHT